MKNMKNFAAQQLTKKQMNKVKGGDINCRITYRRIGDNDDTFTEEGIVGNANTQNEAENILTDKYLSMGYLLDEIHCN